MSIPHLFRCPISLDIFTDPVTLCTGQTYDRPCIERWLAAGHRTCPVTMQPLGEAAALVPNRTLRHLIERWLSADQHVPASTDDDDAEEPSLAALKRCLQSGASANAKVAALKKVATLASESDVGRACMLQLGFLPLLLQLVFHAPTPYDLSEQEELALHSALSLLPSSSSTSPQHNCLNMLKTEATLASFVRLLERGRARVKAGLCRLLETIATAAATRDLAVAAAASPRVWQALLPLLTHDDERVSGAAARAVAAVCGGAAAGSAVHHGAVPALFKCLAWAAAGKGGGGAAANAALAAVEAVATASEAGRRAVARELGGVRALVRHVFVVSSRNEGSEHAVAALLAVCKESRAARSEAVGAGVVTQALLLLQSQCGTKAKNKARSLLKLFKSM